MQRNIPRPGGVTAIAIVNAFGALVTLVFWGLVYFRIFAPGGPREPMDVALLSTVFGFMVGDLTWAAVLLVVSSIGLWRMRAWGYLTGQMVNILWLYSMTVILCRDIYSGNSSPGGLIFLPFVPFSAWASFYLWKVRKAFDARTPVPDPARTQETSG